MTNFQKIQEIKLQLKKDLKKAKKAKAAKMLEDAVANPLPSW